MISVQNYKDIPKKDLEQLYRKNLSLTQIGAHFSVSQHIIRRALEFHQIPKRKPLQKKASEKPLEHRKTLKMAALYQKGATLEEIGNRFGFTRQGVRERFIQAGIAYRRAALKYARIDKKHLVELYSIDNLPLPKIAFHLNVSKPVIMQALNFYEIPKRDSIIKGAYIIKALKSLKIGESKEIEIHSRGYRFIYTTAKRLGIKISVRRLRDSEKLRITRIA